MAFIPCNIPNGRHCPPILFCSGVEHGRRSFALDDRLVNYNRPVKTKKIKSASGGGVHAMDVPSAPGDGDGDDGDDDYSGGSYGTPFSTNGLWLQITNVSNGLAYLNLMNATDSVYEIYSTVALVNSGNSWNIEAEVWPTNGTVMPYTVPELGRTNLFVWARDWTGVTSNGNETPEWWFWKYFGTTNLSDANLDDDGFGDTLLYDYTNDYDPNVIQFSLQFTNAYVSSSLAYGSISILGGVPSYEAILINDTNLADAVWQPYSSTNVTAGLYSGNGIYNVMVGLKGLPSDATQTWLGTQLTLNTVVPVLAVTNPVSGTVSVPMIQLQGCVNESLSKLTFDVSNAVGVVTDQTGYWQPVFYDTNRLDFTTNSFQCYDIKLATGLNQITLHATDLEGNYTTTNFSYTLSYAGVTTAPTLSVVWPPNNAPVGGYSVTIQAQVDDATATVTATVNGNTVQGLVERSGLIWLQNLPLNSGTNVVTITATSAAGNSSTNTLNIVESSVSLSINPISSNQLNKTNVTVTGTISGSGNNVWVNGVQASVGSGSWTVSNVLVSATGTAVINVRWGQTQTTSWLHRHWIKCSRRQLSWQATRRLRINTGSITSDDTPYQFAQDVNWVYDSGGSWSYYGYGADGGSGGSSSSGGSLPPDGPGFATPYTDGYLPSPWQVSTLNISRWIRRQFAGFRANDIDDCADGTADDGRDSIVSG